jgi:hypothetical protein
MMKLGKQFRHRSETRGGGALLCGDNDGQLLPPLANGSHVSLALSRFSPFYDKSVDSGRFAKVSL